MNYETTTYLLNKISEIQEVLFQKPPSLPTNFGYVISRIFLYVVDFIFFVMKAVKKLKIKFRRGFWELH